MPDSFSVRFVGHLGRLAPNVQGALWVLAAALAFTTMGTIVKILGRDFDSWQLAFFRALFGLMAVLPFIARVGWGAVKTRRLPLHLMRAFGGAAAMFCGYYTLTHLAFADAVSISYARTLFLIPLAVLFLGEVVRGRRWTATAIGFLGVVIMVRPAGEIEPATFVAILGAFLVAAVTVMIKKLSQTERPETLIFYFGCISTTLALIPALMVWRGPTPAELALLMLMGAAGAAGQYCMIRGYKVGEATAVIPFDYARLLLAGIVGYLVFAEAPDLWTILGACVIVASTLYIALREARLARRR
ncbi:MAG: DMT family transporter [Alphaproteobacteria bacterium]|jgi:drug/metabolite transporter (DMT)-like permease|nr:DMT family transporter [Alphaproteobacteria bacterium]